MYRFAASLKKRCIAVSTALLLMLAVLCMAACQSPAVDDGPAATPAQEPTPSAAPEDDGGMEADGDANREAMLSAYRAALTDLLERRVLPDGTECECDPESGIAGDSFALYDIDNDGRDELVIVHIAAVMAGQAQYVFDYDESAGRLETKFVGFPMLTFYDNGAIKSEWSHNQGLAGDFWPYSLYSYDPVLDGYSMAGMVDAWDKGFAPVGFGGEPFPDDVDVSGTGFVYYIMPGGDYEQTEPVDTSVYNGWLDAYLAGASALELDYLPLTAENIKGLGV